MGTSKLEYGNPYTIGRLKIVKDWKRPTFESDDFDYQ